VIVSVDASIGIDGSIVILTGIEEATGDRVVFADDVRAAWSVLEMIEAGKAVSCEVEARQVIAHQAFDGRTTVTEMVRDYRRATRISALPEAEEAT